jgi:hypothetical protein
MYTRTKRSTQRNPTTIFCFPDSTILLSAPPQQVPLRTFDPILS